MKNKYYFLCITALCCGTASADGEITRMFSQLAPQLDALISQGTPSVFDHMSDSPVVTQHEETTRTGPIIVKKHTVMFDPSTNTKREVITTESVLQGEGRGVHTIEKSKTIPEGQECHTRTKNQKRKDHQKDLSQKEGEKRRQWKMVKNDPFKTSLSQGEGGMASVIPRLLDFEMRHWPDAGTVSFVIPMDVSLGLDPFENM
jgi:hypothetical protein